VHKTWTTRAPSLYNNMDNFSTIKKCWYWNLYGYQCKYPPELVSKKKVTKGNTLSELWMSWCTWMHLNSWSCSELWQDCNHKWWALHETCWSSPSIWREESVKEIHETSVEEKNDAMHALWRVPRLQVLPSHTVLSSECLNSRRPLGASTVSAKHVDTNLCPVPAMQQFLLG
jgi:hypothetical protein